MEAGCEPRQAPERHATILLHGPLSGMYSPERVGTMRTSIETTGPCQMVDLEFWSGTSALRLEQAAVCSMVAHTSGKRTSPPGLQEGVRAVAGPGGPWQHRAHTVPCPLSFPSPHLTSYRCRCDSLRGLGQRERSMLRGTRRSNRISGSRSTAQALVCNRIYPPVFPVPSSLVSGRRHTSGMSGIGCPRARWFLHGVIRSSCFP